MCLLDYLIVAPQQLHVTSNLLRNQPMLSDRCLMAYSRA
jgi:hypothetical protein